MLKIADNHTLIQERGNGIFMTWILYAYQIQWNACGSNLCFNARDRGKWYIYDVKHKEVNYFIQIITQHCSLLKLIYDKNGRRTLLDQFCFLGPLSFSCFCFLFLFLFFCFTGFLFLVIARHHPPQNKLFIPILITKLLCWLAVNNWSFFVVVNLACGEGKLTR